MLYENNYESSAGSYWIHKRFNDKKKKKRQNETDAKTLSKEVFLFINVVEYEQKKKIVGDIFVLLYWK